MASTTSWNLSIAEIRNLNPYFNEEMVQDYYERQLEVRRLIDEVDSAVTDHDDLTNVTPDQHHNQAHDWDGADHIGLPGTFPPDPHNLVSHTDVTAAHVNRESLVSDGTNWVNDRRNKAHFQLTQPLDADSSSGDLWVAM